MQPTTAFPRASVRVLVLDRGRIVTDLAAPDAATIGDILRKPGAW
jgi:hypothetical protein